MLLPFRLLWWHLKLLALAGLVSLSACNGGGDSSPATLRALEIQPAQATLAAGTSVQLSATAIYTDNTNRDVTGSVAWSSGTPSVVAVDAAGKAAGAAVGTATVSASFEGQSASASLTVTPATVASIAVTPAIASAPAGTHSQFAATATLTDNSTQDVTADVDWATSNATFASISTAGLASGLAQGQVTVTATCRVATCGSATAAATFNITAAQLLSLAVTPATPSIALGTTQQLIATGTFGDNTTRDLSNQVTWTSDNAAVATVSNAPGTVGWVNSVAVGNAQITAQFAGVTSTAITLNVTPATLSSITVTPASPNVAAGLSQQFTAVGIYSDQTTQPLTDQVTWASSNGGVATVSNANGSHGLATTTATGTASITAASGAIASAPVTLTVTPATLVSLAVNPSSASVASGGTQGFAAVGTFTDASTQDLTATAMWTSSAPSVATVSNAAGTKGLATGLVNGATTITALVGSVSSTSLLTVQPNTYSIPGSYTYTVPGGVTAVQVDAVGGGGGGGVYTGGHGGRVTVTMAVSPGDVLNLFVGGGGATDNITGGGGGASTVNAGTPNQVIAGGGGGSGSGTAGNGSGGNGGGNGVAAGSQGGDSSGGFGGSGGTGGAIGTFSGAPGVAGGNGNGGQGGVGGRGAPGGAGAGSGSGGAGGSACCGGGGGGGYGGGAGGGSGPMSDGGGGGGGSTGPSGAVFSLATNRGAAGAAGGNGSITISIVP
ncbi:hypothetical protein GCM10007320_66260 [Pseudorhodoferax aquiterrae]|uniref:BIG2 domain-containing protein n=1 Tax=Pseudorhodoferax aquiterrae TaxID=747304 RepID=A0ABQ3GIC8_9BURK|nr:Ig-like domain-containing protein [Pseudorhodoferax aquiterrae]GHD04884.1 hypothetical protein GCM10007320_66260 [Pseudorhodoferax aquiterrae]